MFGCSVTPPGVQQVREALNAEQLPCTRGGVAVYITHLPEAVFQARLLDNQEGANTERCVFGKLSAICFQRRPFWDRHHSNYEEIEHGITAVIYTVVNG